MTRYVGLDVHKHFIEVCILDRSGKAVFRGRAECRREELECFAKEKLKRSDRVALEATTNTWPVVDILRPFVAEIVVGNPLKTKAIAEAKVKTDKVDAEVLAQLLRCDYLPSVWQPDEPTQRLRGWITHRAALMTQRSRLKNHIQSQLGRLLIYPPCKVLWTKTGLAWLKTVELPPDERLMLESELRQLAAIDRERALLDERLASLAEHEPRAKLLMTIPGVSFIVGLGIIAALGDVRRFEDGAHAAAYLGLVPSTRQSANHCYHGHITKVGNRQARGLLTQAAQHASRHPGPLGAFFRRLTKRKNRSVAITAVARKLVTIAYLMLKNNEPYRYARPDLMREKFAKLKIIKPPAGAKRTAKKPPADLVTVYRAAGLPPVKQPAQLPVGERRMLTERQLEPYVDGLYRPEAPTKKSPATSSKVQPSGRPKGRPG